ENIYTIPGTFAWDDVGSWLSLERINLVDGKGNFIKGNVVEIGTENSVFMSEHRLIAAVGVQNLIVVETDDVTLVCDKDNTQDVKKIVEKLRAQGATQYL
ncbi:MAG: mannose-1-phosphate guanylyltransferase, partial [Ruthenibacterium sp.]